MSRITNCTTEQPTPALPNRYEHVSNAFDWVSKGALGLISGLFESAAPRASHRRTLHLESLEAICTPTVVIDLTDAPDTIINLTAVLPKDVPPEDLEKHLIVRLGQGSRNVTFIGECADGLVEVVGNELPNKINASRAKGINLLVDGGDGADIITGAGGLDTLNGGAGNDRIFGMNGNDLIDGGEGNDILLGGNGDDTVGGLAGNDSLIGGAGLNLLSGDAGWDTLVGGAAKDILIGGDDRDILKGGGGDDDMNGGAGRDDLFGGTGNDRLWGGLGDDNLFGQAGNDELRGEDGDDNLIGHAGNDTIVGGQGSDSLSGGGGNDISFAVEDVSGLQTDSGINILNGGTGIDIGVTGNILDTNISIENLFDQLP